MTTNSLVNLSFIEKEEKRLKALQSYKIYDNKNDTAFFDEISLFASNICKTPFSFVSILDKDSQLLISVNGLAISEIAPKDSICFNYLINDTLSVIQIEDLSKFELEDVSKSPNYKIDPVDQSAKMFSKKIQNIRAFASVPLISPEGLVIGSLCVLDSDARPFPHDQIIGLRNLATQIINKLELTKINDEQNKLLIQYSKLSELGSYAATIAHEINNPLSILNSKVALLEYQAETDGKLDLATVKEFCGSFERNVLRISKIMKGLRNIGRDTRNDPFEQGSLKEIFEDTLELCLKKITNEGVDLRIGKIPNINFECRSAQISQVFLNLFNNAVDAIEKLPQKWVQIEFFDMNESFQIYFTDSGSGIPDEIREKIFSNFFTTKGVGKGTGIGLSVSSEIIKQHSGQLSVDPTKANTTFVISLPKIQNKAS
jgi:signal transduction histidine kinase